MDLCPLKNLPFIRIRHISRAPNAAPQKEHSCERRTSVEAAVALSECIVDPGPRILSGSWYPAVEVMWPAALLRMEFVRPFQDLRDFQPRLRPTGSKPVRRAATLRRQCEGNSILAK